MRELPVAKGVARTIDDHIEVSSPLDKVMLAAYLTAAGWNSAVHTFFREVRKLPPGHTPTIVGEWSDIHEVGALPVPEQMPD